MQTLKFLAMGTKVLEKQHSLQHSLQHSFFDDVGANLKSSCFNLVLK
jgi:hypothetical protein